MQTALDNNNATEAKEILQQFSCRMKEEFRTIDDYSTRENLMKTINIFDDRLRRVEPDKHCSRNDIRKLIGEGGAFLFPELLAGYGIGSAVTFVGFATEGTSTAVKTGLHRCKNKDLTGTFTGILLGLVYGGYKGYLNAFFTGFRTPFTNDEQCKYLKNRKHLCFCYIKGKFCLFFVNFLGTPCGYCDSFYNQMQTALNNNNSAKAKEMFKKHSCQLKQQIPGEQNKQTRQIMTKTVNLFDENLEEIKPEDDCSCEEFKKLFKGILLGVKIMAGFNLGSVTAPINAVVQAVDEAVDIGSCRLRDGNLQGAVTGILLGGLHGLSRGALDQFFTGFGLPLEKQHDRKKCVC